MAVASEAAATTARLLVLLEDGDVQPGIGEVGRGSNPTDPRADDDYGTRRHGSPVRGEAIGVGSVCTRQESMIQAIACMPLPGPATKRSCLLYRGGSLKSSRMSVSISHSKRAM